MAFQRVNRCSNERNENGNEEDRSEISEGGERMERSRKRDR